MRVLKEISILFVRDEAGTTFMGLIYEKKKSQIMTLGRCAKHNAMVCKKFLTWLGERQ